MTWSAVRTGMQTVIKANTTAVSVFDVMPPSPISESDVAVILPGDPLIEPYSHDEDIVTIRVVAMAVRGSQQDGQRALDALIGATGTKSIRAAVNADRTLDGIVESTRFSAVASWGGMADQPGGFQADIIFRATLVNA